MSQCHVIKIWDIIYCYHWKLAGKIEGVIWTRGGNLKLVSDYPRGWPEQRGSLKLFHRPVSADLFGGGGVVQET